MQINKRRIAFIALFSSILCLSVFAGAMAYQVGYKSGFIGALNEVAKVPALDFTWQANPDGTYTLSAYAGNGYQISENVKLDVLVAQYHDGELLSLQHSAGTLTNGGKDWIEQQISGSISTNATLYISCDDTDASGLSAASTQLTSELDANGFTRALGAYASTGVGTWTVSKTFTSSGTQAVQTYGLQWSSTKLSDGNLFGYDTSAVKNTVSTDTLAVTFTLTVS